MNPQMDVLYLNSESNTFNHVLAIFTRTSEPVKLESDVSSFVGDGLIVRPPFNAGDVPIPDQMIPASEIGVFNCSFNPAFLAAPNTLYATVPPGQTTPSQLTSFTNNAAFVTADNPSKLKFTLPAPQPALILIQGPTLAKPQTLLANITTNPTSVVISGLVTGNIYYAMVFVPTYPIAIVQFKG